MYTTMKWTVLLIFTKLVLMMECAVPHDGVPSSPMITLYPCLDTTSIVVWYDVSLPPKERNQYYLYANEPFPANVAIVAKFNADVNLSMSVRTANNTYVTYSLRDGARVSHQYRTLQPGLRYFSYKVKGTSPGVVPYLTSFKVNNVEYCNQPNVGFLDSYTTNTIDNDTPQGCGRCKIKHTGLIVNGAPTKPGDWPWHVAIYKFEYPSIKYICGGSLLSTHFVLTAAHCASERGDPVVAELLSVVLGKYNLYGGDVGSEERGVCRFYYPKVLSNLRCISLVSEGVHRIIIHEEFKHRHLDNDIALLKLKTEVIFTDYIQPACLWYSKASGKLLSDEIIGTVVGWGFDSSNSLSRTIRRAQMPMVSDSVCMASNPNFYTSILSNRKFCAGYRNRTSACNGDSGSAFQVFIPDRLSTTASQDSAGSGTWLVRGIVSLSVARQNENVCDPEQFVVFTDVARYLTWIQNHLDFE